MKNLFGNTYEFREQIKSKGGKWVPGLKCWQIPDDEFEGMQKLINSKEKLKMKYSANVKMDRFGRFECNDCGDDVYAGTTCWETGLTH